MALLAVKSTAWSKNVFENVKLAWLDERPQCKHLRAAWKAGRDVGTRCAGYGIYRRGTPDAQPRDGYCHMNDGICAFEDRGFIFEPGWDTWVRFLEVKGYYISDVWPRFRRGDLVCYRVRGKCMSPTYPAGSLTIVRLGEDHFEDDSACVIQRRMRGLPIDGLSLKRLTRIGDNWLITADAPDFEPTLAPMETVHIVGLAVIADMAQLTPFHVFASDGSIVEAF